MSAYETMIGLTVVLHADFGVSHTGTLIAATDGVLVLQYDGEAQTRVAVPVPRVQYVVIDRPAGGWPT
jgi:hypothetical protein